MKNVIKFKKKYKQAHFCSKQAAAKLLKLNYGKDLLPTFERITVSFDKLNNTDILLQCNVSISQVISCYTTFNFSALSGIWTTIRKTHWSTEWESWRANELSHHCLFGAKLIASKILPLKISTSILTPGQTRTCLVCLLFDWAILFACSRLESIHNVSYQSRPDKY